MSGPPLDVWSLGVILFAILCGRLPFEGPDLIGTKRPREQIIKSRIMKSQYKMDDSLGPEAKDLVRRLLQIDPAERASIPEIFNHVWIRPAVNGNISDTYHMMSLSSNATNRSTPETGTSSILYSSKKDSFRDDPMSPLERADSAPIQSSNGKVSKCLLTIT